MQSIEERIRSTVATLVQWLVEADYSAIEQFTGGVRLPAKLIQDAISEYGKTLVMPPDINYTDMDVVQVNGSVPPSWSIRVRLWTREEGRSDLTLECTLIDQAGALMGTEIDNLHVM